MRAGDPYLQKTAHSTAVTTFAPTFIDKLERLARAGGHLADDEVWAGLRDLRRASRRLVIKPAEDAGVWLVGDADDPRYYTPKGVGFPDLLMLLAQPHRPVPAEDMPGGGTARVAYQRARRAADYLAEQVQCFVFVAPCISTKRGYNPSNSLPRIEVSYSCDESPHPAIPARQSAHQI